MDDSVVVVVDDNDAAAKVAVDAAVADGSARVSPASPRRDDQLESKGVVSTTPLRIRKKIKARKPPSKTSKPKNPKRKRQAPHTDRASCMADHFCYIIGDGDKIIPLRKKRSVYVGKTKRGGERIREHEAKLAAAAGETKKMSTPHLVAFASPPSHINDCEQRALFVDHLEREMKNGQAKTNGGAADKSRALCELAESMGGVYTPVSGSAFVL
jgi:hypothetical protein